VDLFEACMNGLVLSGPGAQEPKPIDFALSLNGRAVVLEANWWTGDWDKDEHLYTFDAEFVPEVVPAGSNPCRWYVDGGSMNLTTTEEATQEVIDRARTRIDINRAAYFAQLDALKLSVSEDYTPLIDDWRARISVREELTPEKIVERRNSARVVGTVFLNDESGKIDVLVVDERGDAVVLNEDSWLESFASDWTDRDDDNRPEVADFIAWIMERRPSTVQTLDGPVVETMTGPLVSIAERAFGLAATSEK